MRGQSVSPHSAPPVISGVYGRPLVLAVLLSGHIEGRNSRQPKRGLTNNPQFMLLLLPDLIVHNSLPSSYGTGHWIEPALSLFVPGGLQRIVNEKQKLIRASGVGEYVYCARAWWLRTEGYAPTSGHEARQFGERWHLRHGQSVMRARRMRILAASTGLTAIIIIIIFLFLWWRG